MTDIHKLALKHGARIHTDYFNSLEGVEVPFKNYTLTAPQLQSLLAEHLALSSSEPVAFGYLDDKGAFTFIERTGYVKVDLFLANPLNQQLLDSHKRLEEALKQIILRGDYTAPEGMKYLARDALATIPESVKESK
jgi:hypothetical protein